MKAEGHGVIRREAVKAFGSVTVTGNGIVEQGSYFQTAAGTRFTVLETVVVTGSAEIPIEAVEAGESGNVAEGAINVIPINIPGIQSVTNLEATHDGYDREDDETYRARYLKHVRLPAVSGNPYQYEEWAMEVEGVGAARCIRAWKGPNSVKLIIVDSNMKTASDYLIQQVFDHLGASPMTVANTNKLVNLFTDDGKAYVDELPEDGTIKVIIPSKKAHVNEMRDSLDEMLPAHLVYDIRHIIEIDEDEEDGKPDSVKDINDEDSTADINGSAFFMHADFPIFENIPYGSWYNAPKYNGEVTAKIANMLNGSIK